MSGPYRAEPTAIARPSWWRRVIARLSCAFTGHWYVCIDPDPAHGCAHVRCVHCGRFAVMAVEPLPSRPVIGDAIASVAALAWSGGEHLDNAPLIEAVRDERRAAAQRRRA